MTSEQMVSIILPVYNGERYIEECILSIRRQEYSNIEIIIIDDGSTDNTFEICQRQKSKDGRISYFYKKNEGVSSARNLGLIKACGDYICFVDADDIISKKFVSSFIECIDEGADIIMCKMTSDFNEIDIEKTKNKYTLSKSEALQGILFVNKYHGYVCNKMFNREILKIPFNEDIYVGEDFLFTIQAILNSNKLVFIDEKNYYYRRHGKSATNNFNSKKTTILKAYDLILLELQRFYKNNNNYMNEFINAFYDNAISIILQAKSHSYWNNYLQKWFEKMRKDMKLCKLSVRFKMLSLLCFPNITVHLYSKMKKIKIK